VSLPDGPAGGGRASPGGLVLRIENLSKHFGGARALDGVSFGVGPREVHGLLGQNGSGKSTLIKVLAGFHEPDPGARLWVGGTEVALPNDSPALSPGQACSGCHRISRDGKRFAYTFNGGNFEFGALAYDAKLGLFTSKITPTVGVRGTYATFNPLESSTTPAMLVTLPDDVSMIKLGLELGRLGNVRSTTLKGWNVEVPVYKQTAEL